MHKTPGKAEVTACRHWLEEELARVQPVILVALGSTALTSLMGNSVTLAQNIGRRLGHARLWVIPGWHPSEVLRLQDSAASDAAFTAIVDALKSACSLIPPER